MSAREDGVRLNFHINLFQHCIENGTIDLKVPASGADQFLTADDIFGHEEFYFLVEFKSWKHSLKHEDRKPAACNLCMRLASDVSARNLHDRGHFAAWGHRPDETSIPIQMGVYRKMVCNKATLLNCAAVQVNAKAGLSIGDNEFLKKLHVREYGIEYADFINYLKWLLGSTKPGAISADFPLDLYGGSLVGAMEGAGDASGKLSLAKARFTDYQHFNHWAMKVTQRKSAKNRP